MIKDYMAIINLEENESDIRSLTTNRPIASIPIGSRYRVIDFILSNLVNCGIKNVGIFSQSNSRSLSDHIGTGKPWDLNRKNDGVFLFSHGLNEMADYDSKLLRNNMEYIYRSHSEYVVLTSSYMIYNMDLTEVAEYHENSGNDVTVVYTHTDRADEAFQNCFTLSINPATNRVEGVGRNIGYVKDANICMELFLMKKDLLIDLIYKNAHDGSSARGNFYNVIFNNLDNLKFSAFEFKGYVSCIHSIASYYETNMEMLGMEVSTELFRSRPVYTKIKDEHPTLYVKGCKVSHSLVADGCIIHGSVNNSVLGRYVNVEEDAVVDHCIILQNCHIGKGARLSNVIIDKNVEIDAGTELKGSDVFPLVIEKKNLLSGF